jgi:hypothetical protein
MATLTDNVNELKTIITTQTGVIEKVAADTMGSLARIEELLGTTEDISTARQAVAEAREQLTANLEALQALDTLVPDAQQDNGETGESEE